MTEPADHPDLDPAEQAIVDQVLAAGADLARRFETMRLIEETAPLASGHAFTTMAAAMVERMQAAIVARANDGDPVACVHITPGTLVHWPSWSRRWLCKDCCAAAGEYLFDEGQVRCDCCGQDHPADYVQSFHLEMEADVSNAPYVRPALEIIGRICRTCKALAG